MHLDLRNGYHIIKMKKNQVLYHGLGHLLWRIPIQLKLLPCFIWYIRGWTMDGSFSHSPFRCDLSYFKAHCTTYFNLGIDNWFPMYLNSSSNFALRSTISCGFWFFTRTMETSMCLVQSLWIESSNHGLLAERHVTKPLESTWMD